MRQMSGRPHVACVWETHYVTPLAHFRNLRHQALPCGPLQANDSYYVLEALPREGGSSVTFVAERRHAEKLLTRGGRFPLPIFNPLYRSCPNRGTERDPRAGMTGLNADLYDAIHMLCIVSGNMPRNGITRTLETLRANPEAPVKKHEIVRFAHALEQGNEGRPLSHAIDRLRKAIPGVREFPFTFLRSRLLRENLAACL
jgi:hypothetical protein